MKFIVVVLMYLLLTLNTFITSMKYFYCYVWAYNCILSILETMSQNYLHFLKFFEKIQDGNLRISEKLTFPLLFVKTFALMFLGHVPS